LFENTTESVRIVIRCITKICLQFDNRTLEWEPGRYNTKSVNGILWYGPGTKIPLASLIKVGLEIQNYDVRKLFSNDLLSTEIKMALAPIGDTALIGIYTSQYSLAWGD
jgi:hypothetical protein